MHAHLLFTFCHFPSLSFFITFFVHAKKIKIKVLRRVKFPLEMGSPLRIIKNISYIFYIFIKLSLINYY